MPIHGYPGNVITANPTAPTVSSASGVWTTEQQLINQSAGRWPMAATQISRSLRFNSADSAYLNRTPASASNRKTWTWSGWVKRSVLARQMIFTTPDGTYPTGAIEFNSTNNITWIDYTSVALGYALELTTTQVFRDVSAWYHLVFVFDTTQATSSNRAKLYVNGTQVTAFSASTYPSQNYDGGINTATQHRLGSQSNRAAQFLDAYLTEVNFIDGLALDPSYFGFNNSDTGVWTPRQYTGAYGTNGFYLNFSDNSGTTSTTLGKDSSGNGNNWTPNNFSVTAGSGNDSMVDSPTSYGTDTGVGGEVRGNYCTLNPLRYGAGSGSTVTISEGNLKFNCSSNAGSIVATINIPSSGKWYWEAVVPTQTYNFMFVGVIKNQEALSNLNLSIGNLSTGYGVYAFNGQKYNNGSSSTYMAATAQNTVMTVAYDADTGSLYVGAGGSWANGSGSTNQTWANAVAAYTGLTGNISPAMSFDTGNAYINFGQRAFAYTAPSGFKALCTQNLPTPTIGATSTTQADNYFGVALYSGTGSGNSNVVSGLEFTTDLWWQKARNAANNNYLQDAVRGFGASKSLTSNSTGSEGFNGTPLTQSLSVSSTGFTVSGSDFNGNTASETYVAWCWNAGGSNATNTAGTITSTVRANTTSGFSIVTYTGTGSAATIGHGLGVAPSMIIIKNRQAANSWAVYHISTGANQQLILNSTNGISSDTQGFTAVPSSTVFSVGTGAAMDTNQTSGGGQHVAYCFAPVAGYSAFGSYTGNGSTDGPFVYTGFRPRYVLVKRTDTGGAGFDWFIWDTARSTYNAASANLTANQSVAEGVTAYPLDINSNGLKITNSATAYNASGGTYIYAAFAESPFKYALAR